MMGNKNFSKIAEQSKAPPKMVGSNMEDLSKIARQPNPNPTPKKKEKKNTAKGQTAMRWSYCSQALDLRSLQNPA